MFINKNEKIIVAVSGGPDSMYLLNDLVNQGYTNIFVCHVNYNFRKESNIDEQIIKNFTEKNNLILKIKSIPKETYNNDLGNFESFARKERYDFFVEIAKENNIKFAFIAHNLNDSIETYILQKQRGSIVNYFGLQPVSNYKNLTIVRPLLNIKKSDILNFNKNNNINYAIDSTNSDIKYARNKIRVNLKESEFINYLKLIKDDNLINEKNKNEAKFYANNNLTASELRLTESFFNFDVEKIMMIIIYYLKLIKEDNKLLHRTNNTLREIAESIKTTSKKFLKIKVGDYFFIRDYNFIYFVKKDWFDFYNIKINSKEELEKIKIIQEWVHVEQVIDKDGFNFPYLISNDYEYYKTFTNVKGKKTNRFFIDKKIPYKSRYKKPAVINLNNNKILNIKRVF